MLHLTFFFSAFPFTFIQLILNLYIQHLIKLNYKLMEEQAKIPVFKASLLYGLIHGLAIIVVSLIFYFLDVSFKTWAIVASILISVGVLVVLLIYMRSEYGKGFIRFGQVVGASVIISITSSLLVATYSFAHYSVDENYLQDTKYYALDQMEKQFTKADAKYQERLSDDQYDRFDQEMQKRKKKAVDKVKNRTPFALAIGSVFNSIFLGVIIGLLTGAFIKKEYKPEGV